MNGQHLMRIARKGPEQFVDPAYIVDSFEGACGIYLSALDLVVLSLWGMATAPDKCEVIYQRTTDVASIKKCTPYQGWTTMPPKWPSHAQ